MKLRTRGPRNISLILMLVVSVAHSGSQALPKADLSPVLSIPWRVVADSASCWLLVPASTRPEGPGLWLRLPLAQCKNGRTRDVNVESGTSSTVRVAHSLPVIRGGDQLLVEEHFNLADVCLLAEALGPARIGESFRVRLAAGGAVIRAVAVSPGHAVLTPDAGVRP